jgi:putative FmdB family regulatory protein
MPLFDFYCPDCGRTSELLVGVADFDPVCPACGGNHLEKQLSAPSSLTGRAPQGLPGPGDTSCCGSNPQAAGCAGPGSCCGKAGG